MKFFKTNERHQTIDSRIFKEKKSKNKSKGTHTKKYHSTNYRKPKRKSLGGGGSTSKEQSFRLTADFLREIRRQWNDIFKVSKENNNLDSLSSGNILQERR